MITAFQASAFQNDAFQVEADAPGAFQCGAFQLDAFQIDPDCHVLATVTEATGPTRVQHLRFTAVRAAEAHVAGVQAQVDCSERLVPRAGAAARLVGQVGYALGTAIRSRAAGRAVVRGQSVVIRHGVVAAHGCGYTGIAGVAVVAAVGVVVPTGSARAQVMGRSVYVELGGVAPYGVQNPTDEELAALVVQLTRRRPLDSSRAYR